MLIRIQPDYIFCSRRIIIRDGKRQDYSFFNVIQSISGNSSRS